MKFKEWLLILETSTIAQYIKQLKSNPTEKEIFNNLKNKILNYLNSNFPSNIPIETKNLYANFLSYHTFKKEKSTNIAWVLNTLGLVKDFLINKINDNALKSKLNSINYSIDDLVHASQNWHQELETKKAKPARPAKTLIDLSYLGNEWKGWRWVSLDQSYCEMEKESAGHCGNAAFKEGDNILSLRDSQNIAHLTFIENNGILGETKGRNNQKPSIKYHAPIFELLKHEKIKTIKGGGYKPENNFFLQDLPKEQQNELLKSKPKLDYSSHRKEVIENVLKLPEKEQIKEINKILNERFYIDEHDDFVYQHFNLTETFLAWMEKYTSTSLPRNLDISFLDKLDQIGDYIEVYDEEIKDAVSNLNDTNFSKIKNLATKSNINIEKPEDIFELDDSNKDILLQPIKNALIFCYQNNLYDSYYQEFTTAFKSDSNDALLIKIYGIDDIRLVLNKNKLPEILSKYDFDKHDYVTFDSLIEGLSFDSLLSDLTFRYHNIDHYQHCNPNEFNQTLEDYL